MGKPKLYELHLTKKEIELLVEALYILRHGINQSGHSSDVLEPVVSALFKQLGGNIERLTQFYLKYYFNPEDPWGGIDEKIKPLVSLLNSLGLETTFSCEGQTSMFHVKRNLHSMAYISFTQPLPPLLIEAVKAQGLEYTEGHMFSVYASTDETRSFKNNKLFIPRFMKALKVFRAGDK